METGETKSSGLVVRTQAGQIDRKPISTSVSTWIALDLGEKILWSLYKNYCSTKQQIGRSLSLEKQIQKVAVPRYVILPLRSPLYSSFWSRVLSRAVLSHDASLWIYSEGSQI